jgi:hypothetical protein|tara:strand:- start:5504 stop:5704 length:201 start_codon:yes stop_codon:yes gene_type:complete
MSDAELVAGDLVNVRSWRNNSSQLGVIVRPIQESQLSDFSRYEILIEDKIVSIRRDRLEKIEKKNR